jgi:MoxR-like ATPase
MLSYKKVFNPKKTEIFKTPGAKKAGAAKEQYAGDRRDGLVYVYDDDIVLAVNVALSVKRPLLIRGASGSGKSSLALNVARYFKWRYYEVVISSGTQARDLLWQFDTLRRLSDAQADVGVKDDVHYVEPGVLWWAFEPESARLRGAEQSTTGVIPAIDPNKGEGDEHERAVVLLDEIDKADPDTPNNLLVPLGSLEFFVTDAKRKVKAKEPPLVVITSNDERELPTAFLRRCIMLNLKPPTRARLVDIAVAHFGRGNRNLYEEVAKLLVPEDDPNKTEATESKSQQSAAEYLDTVSACLALDIEPKAKDTTWEALSRVTLWKPKELPGAN